jgi:hypothetical protein
MRSAKARVEYHRPRVAGPDPKSSEADEQGAVDPFDLDALEEAGEVDALLAAAQALRAGRDVPRDLPACFRAYDAATRLGSAEAAYATALFLLRGGVVPQDEKEAVTRLRTAADAGNLSAKVYLANMYEAGVYFRADPEKADVWHRSLARSAGIGDPVGSPRYIRAMAEQGVGRYATLLAREVPSAEGDALKKKAAAFGWRTPQRTMPKVIDPVPPPPVSSRPTAAATRVSDPGPRNVLTSTAPATPKSKADVRIEPAVTAQRDARARAQETVRISRPASLGTDWGGGILRFVFLCMFAAAGLAAAHLARQGAALLVAQGRPVPIVGPHLDAILPAVLGVLVLLPALGLYRLSAVARALVLATLTGVGGMLAWGHPHVTLVADALTQGVVLALAGFLAGMLVFGFTKRRPPVRKILTRRPAEDDEAAI